MGECSSLGEFVAAADTNGGELTVACVREAAVRQRAPMARQNVRTGTADSNETLICGVISPAPS
jgi:hypothetical protein